MKNIEEQLVSVSNDYAQSYIKKDISLLDSILADDWMLITAGCGKKISRDEHLRDLKDGTLQVEGIKDSEVEIRVYGDAAVLTGRRESKVSYRNRDVSDQTLFSQFYALQDGRWRCVSSQVSSIPENLRSGT
jgi:hypothetical protein